MFRLAARSAFLRLFGLQLAYFRCGRLEDGAAGGEGRFRDGRTGSGPRVGRLEGREFVRVSQEADGAKRAAAVTGEPARFYSWPLFPSFIYFPGECCPNSSDPRPRPHWEAAAALTASPRRLLLI